MNQQIVMLAGAVVAILPKQHGHALVLATSLLAREKGKEHLEKYGPALAEAEFRRSAILLILLFLVGLGGILGLPCTGLCLLAEGLFVASVLVGVVVAFLGPRRLLWAFLQQNILAGRPYLLTLWAALYLMPPADAATRRVLLALVGLYAVMRLLTTQIRRTETFTGLAVQARYRLLWEITVVLSVIGVLLANHVIVVVGVSVVMWFIVTYQETDMWPVMKAEGWA